MIVKMVQFGREVKRPCVEALMVLVVVMISFGKFGNLVYSSFLLERIISR